MEVTDLTQLDADQVRANRAELAARLQAANPTLYLKRGVLHDLVLHQAAILATRNLAEIDRWRRSSSLAEIEADPTLADAEIVDNLLSNYGLTRQQATAARGTITVVVSADTTVTIPQGSVWTCQGQEFTADQTYVAKAEASLVISSTDRLLVRRQDGNYYFTMEVTAVTAGLAGKLRRDQLILPDAPPQTYVTSYVTSDFTGGLNAQTNAELLVRLREGLAAKSLGASRINMQAWTRDPTAEPDFSRILTMSIIGHGQPEQRRYHGLFPMAFGGRLDWWVRTAGQVLRRTLVKTCRLVEKRSDGSGFWQFDLDIDEAAGMYDVFSVRRAGENELLGTHEIVEDTRGYDLTTTLWAPDVTSAEEAAYSRFQTAVVRFHDRRNSTATLEVGDTYDYEVVLRNLPDIAAIQDRVGDADHRPRLCDVLVRAAVPCFVGLSCTIYKQAAQASPDLTAIQTAVREKVEAVGFVGELPSAPLTEAIQRNLTAGMSLGALRLVGAVRRPDGTTVRLRSTERLVVPDEPQRLVSARTVQFFLAPEDIAITVALNQTVEV
jgi:hypothetical protein